MNKTFFVLGFLMPLPAFFNDGVAEYIQDLGGPLWNFFYGFGITMYPIYLCIFILPTFLVIAIVGKKIKPEWRLKSLFIQLFYGFIASSMLFIVVALIAISQYRFSF